MDRRKTLGALSPGSLNSRASLAPGRFTKDAAKATGWASKVPLDKAMSRMSLAGPVQRRSSAYTTTKASGLKSDPRPVGDKQYQANCARTIITYLATHNYEYQINPKVLASPTTKDFTNIMLFLLRRLDPLTAKGPVKLEEEVPVLYKRLRYPFQISKSNLTAVGSPHTWPSILAALAWLVELLNYQDQAEHAVQMASPEEGADAAFFEYVAQSYRYFMAGDDEKCEAVDASKAAEFDERAGEITSATQRLLAANESLEQEIATARDSPSPLVAARARLEETQADKEKFLKLIASLEARPGLEIAAWGGVLPALHWSMPPHSLHIDGSHKASLDRKVAERRSDVAAQASELEGVERECASLRARLAVQTVRPADVQRMAAERVAAERELRAATAAREALEARLAAAERALGSALDALEGALGRYHARAAALQLVPAGAKRAGGCAYEVAYDRGAAAAGALPAPDWKGGVRRGLEELAGAYRSRARALGSERLSLRERAANLATAAGDRREEVAAAQAELARLEAAQEGLKDALAALVEAEGRQVAELQAEVAALRGKGGSTLAASEEDLRELQARYEDDVRAMEAQNAALHRDLAAALEHVLHHKLHVQDKLKGAGVRLRRVLEECRACKVCA
ncbi:hypothetical protein ACKKBF_B11390 [Auxenochlorella protothecoides x Auxenochlorella symbiontica]